MRWTILVGIVLILGFVSGSPGQDKSTSSGEKKSPQKYRVVQVAHKTLEEWIEEIKDLDKGKAENAIRTLMLFGQQEAQKAVPVLVAEMRKRPPIDTSIRVNIAIVLGQILGGYGDPNPSAVKDAVAVLRGCLTDSQSIVKMRAAEALGRIGEDAREAVPDLINKSMKDLFTWETRGAAVVALGAIGRQPGKAPDPNSVQALYNRVSQDNTAQVRLAAIKALARFGPYHQDNELYKRFNYYLRPVAERDPDLTVRVWAEVALITVNKKRNQVVEEPRLRHIAKLMQSPKDISARVQAAIALGNLGPDAASQFDYLVKALRDEDEEVVGWAAWALGRIGTRARPALAVLQKMKTGTKNPALQYTFQESIDAIEGKVSTPEKKGSFLCPEPRWFLASSPLYASAWAPEPYTPSHLFWARIEASGKRG